MTAQGQIRSRMRSMTNEKEMNISAQASRASCLQKQDVRTAENREIRVASQSTSRRRSEPKPRRKDTEISFD